MSCFSARRRRRKIEGRVSHVNGMWMVQEDVVVVVVWKIVSEGWRSWRSCIPRRLALWLQHQHQVLMVLRSLTWPCPMRIPLSFRQVPLLSRSLIQMFAGRFVFLRRFVPRFWMLTYVIILLVRGGGISPAVCSWCMDKFREMYSDASCVDFIFVWQ